MSNVRHFTGSREPGKKSIAREIMQLEFEKKGKIPAELRYKIIFKRKQEEAKEKAMKAMNAQQSSGGGKMVTQRKMSERAEHALKEIAMKKAAKEQKKLRKMVVVQPQNFSNGSINKKGQIFDIAGNIVGQVNTKNGAMSVTSGWSIGKYKPKSYMTKLLIEQAINKHSPYFIEQRKQAAMLAARTSVHGSAFEDPNVLNVQGMSAQGAMLGGLYGAQHADHGIHGIDPDKAQSLGATGGMTAWGAMSSNVFGTFSGNVHGTTADNVHGTVSSDVWGSVSGGSMWGQKGVRLYGTGSGTNHLSGVMKHILAFFGYQSKGAREAQRQLRALRAAGVGGGGGAGGGGSRPSSAPRSGGRR